MLVWRVDGRLSMMLAAIRVESIHVTPFRAEPEIPGRNIQKVTPQERKIKEWCIYGGNERRGPRNFILTNGCFGDRQILESVLSTIVDVRTRLSKKWAVHTLVVFPTLSSLSSLSLPLPRPIVHHRKDTRVTKRKPWSACY